MNLLPEEQVTRDFAYASVVAIKDIQEGENLSESNLWVKRPGIGEIKAEDYENILGRKANSFIASGNHLSWSDIK